MGEQERVSVPDAASRLGTTEGALRKRIARGTLPHERDAEGRVWVLLDARVDESTQQEDTEHPTGQDRTQELIEELQDRVRSLEDANRENRRIIAALTSRIPQLEAPNEPQNQPEAATEEPQRDTPYEEPERATEKPPRSWWRKIFGGRAHE